VIIASTTWNRYPGRMKSRLSPRKGTIEPAAAAVSRLRTLVVPTATTRPPAARAARMRAQAASSTSSHSACISCSSMRDTRTGWKVPAPTCRVMWTVPTPASARRSSIASSKWSPAVGAATAPGRRA
jgi:hypothetical protein